MSPGPYLDTGIVTGSGPLRTKVIRDDHALGRDRAHGPEGNLDRRVTRPQRLRRAAVLESCIEPSSTWPGSERATVDEVKLLGYLPDPEGKAPCKARYFASLGYTRENWQELRDALLERLPQVEGRFKRTSAAGCENWKARILLPGRQRPAEVETI